MNAASIVTPVIMNTPSLAVRFCSISLISSFNSVLTFLRSFLRMCSRYSLMTNYDFSPSCLFGLIGETGVTRPKG